MSSLPPSRCLVSNAVLLKFSFLIYFVLVTYWYVFSILSQQPKRGKSCLADTRAEKRAAAAAVSQEELRRLRANLVDSVSGMSGGVPAAQPFPRTD